MSSKTPKYWEERMGQAADGKPIPSRHTSAANHFKWSDGPMDGPIVFGSVEGFTEDPPMIRRHNIRGVAPRQPRRRGAVGMFGAVIGLQILAVVLLLLLSGCGSCESFAETEWQTYKQVWPRHEAYLEADDTLTPEQLERRKRTGRGWKRSLEIERKKYGAGE